MRIEITSGDILNIEIDGEKHSFMANVHSKYEFDCHNLIKDKSPVTISFGVLKQRPLITGSLNDKPLFIETGDLLETDINGEQQTFYPKINNEHDCKCSSISGKPILRMKINVCKKVPVISDTNN